MKLVRNQFGFTLPFALILTFIFSSLVGVAFVFVAINLNQMQGSLKTTQALVLAEGINERIKTRLNTKTMVMLTPEEESKLDGFADDFGDDDEEDLFDDDDFDESTELFSEYYADEVVKISRYITFRTPPETEEGEEEFGVGSLGDLEDEEEEEEQRPEANVATIGNIDVPPGTVLSPGFMLVVHKEEKIDLMLKDISEDGYQPYRQKLPSPVIRSLSPNYGEANSKGTFVIIGENIAYDDNAKFIERDIVIEDIKGGPLIEYYLKPEVMPGIYKFYWDTAKAEFYVIPPYEGLQSPIIDEILVGTGDQLLDVRAGERGIALMVYGYDLYLNKSLPVVVPDAAGIIPRVKDGSVSGNEITLTLDIDKRVEPGPHFLFVATEGGISNTWVFNVLPPDENAAPSSPSVAVYTTSLTLLDINPIENLLPLIDEDELDDEPVDAGEEEDVITDPEDPDFDPDDLPESDKLGPFSNADLETSWLLETEVMVGMATRTVSEVISRRVPKINAALLTNGVIVFNGGGFRIVGATTAMTELVEPTYLTNTEVKVKGPPDEDELGEPGFIDQAPDANAVDPVGDPNAPPAANEEELPQSPEELGFAEGEFAAVYKAGDDINMLDYAIINMLGNNTIGFSPPGLKEFHYEGDGVFQFVPPVISKEEITQEEAERHLVPKDFALNIPSAANFKTLFGSNLNQYAELADLYTNDPSIPQDEFDLPVGFMNLTYIDGTSIFDEGNNLVGKGLLIVDTRADNVGRPDGVVEINGDSRNPAEFTGVVYIKGNLRIGGNITINGAIIVDNGDFGQVEIASNAIGMITYDERAIKQTILSIPFTTKPGTVMISSKPLDLGSYVLSGTKGNDLGASSTLGGPSAESALVSPMGSAPTVSEEDLIKFFE